MPKKLAIVGSGPSIAEMPFDDPAFEVWSLACFWPELPRLDVAFEVHDKIDCKNNHIWDAVCSCPAPVYMLRAFNEVKNYVRYPFTDVCNAFTVPPRVKPLLTCTPAYMLALALLHKQPWESIHCFGVDLAQDSEFAYQCSSVEFFVGVAVGRGIPIYLTEASDLLKTKYLYGYEDRFREAEVKDLRLRIQSAQQKKDEAEKFEQQWRERKLKTEGALLDAYYQLRRAER